MTDTVETAEVEQGDSPSRRDLLGRGAIIAAVAAVAGVAVARPAAAANGGNMIIGGANSGTATTALTGGSTLRVVNGSSSSQASIVGLTQFSASIGVYGVDGGSSSSNGVRGTSASSGGAGVYGESTDSVNVGSGVIGFSEGGTGVVGRGNAYDLQADLSGRVLLNTAGASNPPTGGLQGTIARDGAANLWYCHTNGQWRKLTGATSAGSFHAVDPTRVYDSRAAAPAPGVLGPNSSRVVSVADGRNNAGVVNVANIVPAGASAVTFNVTATGTTGGNFLSVAPGNAASSGASTLNWAGGYDIANGSVVKLDGSRQVKVFMGDQGGSSHFIIDITGYYL
jgi:hypothetical protein